jgi:hypothetical protein
MWPKLRFDASAVRSPFASFAAAACVAARACVYGSTPRLIRRTPIVWSSARVAASWGLTRTLTGLEAMVSSMSKIPHRKLSVRPVRTIRRAQPRERLFRLVSVRFVAPSYSSVGAVGSAADGSCVLRPRVAAGGWPDEFGRSVDQELIGRFRPD